MRGGAFVTGPVPDGFPWGITFQDALPIVRGFAALSISQTSRGNTTESPSSSSSTPFRSADRGRTVDRAGDVPNPQTNSSGRGDTQKQNYQETFKKLKEGDKGVPPDAGRQSKEVNTLKRRKLIQSMKRFGKSVYLT